MAKTTKGASVSWLIDYIKIRKCNIKNMILLADFREVLSVSFWGSYFDGLLKEKGINMGDLFHKKLQKPYFLQSFTIFWISLPNLTLWIVFTKRVNRCMGWLLFRFVGFLLLNTPRIRETSPLMQCFSWLTCHFNGIMISTYQQNKHREKQFFWKVFFCYGEE